MARESLVLDGVELNDLAGNYVLQQLSMPPPRKRLEWVESDDSDGALLLRDPLFENREIEARIRVSQQVTMDAALAKIAAIQAKLEEAERQRDGLPLVWTPNGSTKSYTLYVLTGEIVDLPIDRTGDGRGWFLNYPLFTVRMTAGPFGYGAEVGTLLDTFATDTIANYTFDTGAGTLSVAGGQLVPSSVAHKQAYHSAKGQLYDQQVTLKYTTGASVAGNAGVLAKRLDGTNYLLARTLSDGTNATLTLFVNNNDDFALSSQVAITNLAANTSYWIRIRVEGNKVTAEHWTSAPTPGASPAATRTLTLTGANATKFGEGVKSYAGLKTTPAGTDWRYDDFEVAPNVWQSSDPLLTGTIPGVEGDVPAEARLIVTDNAGQNRRHVEWGREQRHYGAHAVILDSDADLVTAGFAGAQATRTGAYDPNASGNNVIRTTVYEETTECCGTGNQPHIGTWRVKARVDATDVDVRLRLAWQAGDGPFAYNAFVAPPAIDVFSEVDLGLIHVREKRLGTQRWSGKIEAYGPAAGATLDVDAIYLVPAGEGYGKARAGDKPVGKGNLQAKDAFDSIAAGTALNARVAPLGGSWATSGAATDFAAADAPDSRETMSRSTTSEASARLAALGATSYTDMRVECAVRWATTATPSVATELGVVARYVDANNHLYAVLNPAGEFKLFMIVGGSLSLLNAIGGREPLSVAANTWYAIVLTVYSTGVAIAELQTGASAPIAAITAVSSALATGGALDDGKPGMRDKHGSAGAVTRYYEDFYVHKPPPEPIVCYSGQSIEFRSAGEDAALREDATGTYWGQPPQAPRGRRFALGEAGDENRTNRVVVKLRRSDIEAAADANIADSQIVQVVHTPRFLAVPR